MKRLLKKIVTFILSAEARVVLWRYKPHIIAITGSVGKTATKDAIGAVLSKKFFTRSSEKSFNSEIGVPLTILGREESGWSNPFLWLRIFTEGLALIFLKNHYPRQLVLEIGAGAPGDIRRVCKWLKPDIAVITKFGEVPAHVEFFSSREELIREKAHLAGALKKDGVLILNADDPDVYALGEKADRQIVAYGFGDRVLVRGSVPEIFCDKEEKPAGVQCKVAHKGNVVPMKLYGTTGTHLLYAGLAALATGSVRGVNMVEGLEALAEMEFPPGRMRILSGINGAVLIDDSYNASPAATEAALASLEELCAEGRKIVVLGDMLELGKESVREHERIGERAARFADMLVTVGPRAKSTFEVALVKGMVPIRAQRPTLNARYKRKGNGYAKHFDNARDAGAFVKILLTKGDAVLVKGSQSMRMERAVEMLMAEPEEKHKLLVRQEKEWELR